MNRKYSQQTLQLNEMRKALEEEYAKKRKVMEKANLEANKQLVSSAPKICFIMLFKKLALECYETLI